MMSGALGVQLSRLGIIFCDQWQVSPGLRNRWTEMSLLPLAARCVPRFLFAERLGTTVLVDLREHFPTIDFEKL